jgi:hypothetical protein
MADAPRDLSWEERARLRDIEQNLAAEDPDFAQRMRRPRPVRRIRPMLATVLVLLLATPFAAVMSIGPLLIVSTLIIGVFGAAYRWRSRSAPPRRPDR